MFIFSGNLVELDRSEKFLQSLAELAWFGMNVQKFYMAYQFAGILGLGCVFYHQCVSFKLFTLCSVVIWNCCWSYFPEGIRHRLTKPWSFTYWICYFSDEQGISLNLGHMCCFSINQWCTHECDSYVPRHDTQNIISHSYCTQSRQHVEHFPCFKIWMFISM